MPPVISPNLAPQEFSGMCARAHAGRCRQSHDCTSQEPRSASMAVPFCASRARRQPLTAATRVPPSRNHRTCPLPLQESSHLLPISPLGHNTTAPHRHRHHPARLYTQGNKMLSPSHDGFPKTTRGPSNCRRNSPCEGEGRKKRKESFFSAAPSPCSSPSPT